MLVTRITGTVAFAGYGFTHIDRLDLEGATVAEHGALHDRRRDLRRGDGGDVLHAVAQDANLRDFHETNPVDRRSGVALVSLQPVRRPQPKNTRRSTTPTRGSTQAKGHHKFDDHDRDVTREWCVERQRPAPGRVPAGGPARARIRGATPGRRDPRRAIFEVRSTPCRSSLVRLLPPPPVSHHYIAIGGHVALLDASRRSARPAPHSTVTPKGDTPFLI